MLIILLNLLSSPFLVAQPSSHIEAIMDFLGIYDPQELDADEVERMSGILSAPISINHVSMTELRSSGLMSPYQVAVLQDYRMRHGPVMSLSELALMDGFGEEFVRRLSPFIQIETELIYPVVDSLKVEHDIAMRGSYKWRSDQGSDGSYAVKYRAAIGRKYIVSTSVSRSSGSGSWTPSSVCGSFLWRFEKVDGQLVAGDFNARFGQGLTQWNGAFITSLTTPDSFMKRPTGLSMPWSFTGSSSLSGLAADFALGSFVLTSVLALPGIKDVARTPGSLNLMPVVNTAWRGRNGQASLTNVMTFSPLTKEYHVMTGLDGAFCIKGVNLFGEVSTEWKGARIMALAGSRFRAGENLDMAVQLRCFHNEQAAAALSGEFSFGERIDIYGKEGFGTSRLKNRGHFVVDATYFPVSKDKKSSFSLQLKSQFLWDFMPSPALLFKFRISERVRSWGQPLRTDVRADVVYNMCPFSIMMRLNILSCDGVGLLSYAEGGYSGDMLTLYFRQGIFFIDDWDDRIYVYERDAPGSFNAPAFYGRGLWASAVMGLRFSYKLRLYARASYICYPFMDQEKKKPGKAELKLQLQYRF